MLLVGYLALLVTTARADGLRTVCATDTMARLNGVQLGVSDAMLERARSIVSKASDEWDRSPHSRQDFPVIFDKKVEWSDGTAVGLTCTLNATLNQIQGRGFVIDDVKVETITSKFNIEPRQWTKFTYAMHDTAIGFDSTLVCEAAASRVAKGRPLAPLDRTLLEIGQFQNLMSDRMPPLIRTETDPARCAALRAQGPGSSASTGQQATPNRRAGAERRQRGSREAPVPGAAPAHEPEGSSGGSVR